MPAKWSGVDAQYDQGLAPTGEDCFPPLRSPPLRRRLARREEWWRSALRLPAMDPRADASLTKCGWEERHCGDQQPVMASHQQLSHRYDLGRWEANTNCNGEMSVIGHASDKGEVSMLKQRLLCFCVDGQRRATCDGQNCLLVCWRQKKESHGIDK